MAASDDMGRSGDEVLEVAAVVVVGAVDGESDERLDVLDVVNAIDDGTVDGELALGRETAAKVERDISASLLRLRSAAPFFATLALHARFVARHDIPTAATDGRDVLYNPVFLGALTRAELDGVLLHEVLHAALAHVARRERRDPKGWNIAADIVVNGLVTQNGFELPEGAVRDAALEGYSVEEIYAMLPKQQVQHDLSELDLIEPTDDGERGESGSGDADGDGKERRRRARLSTDADGDVREGALSDAQRKAVERKWRKAISQAASVARGTGQGNLPVGVERAFGLRVGTSQLDWRSLLWRFLTRADTDFGAFDRRHVHRGLYLETLETQSLRAYICVDTSGSIEDEQVRDLLAETQAVLRAYPTMEGWLWFADADVYGPYRLDGDGPLPTPQGGGGTDFRPFFEAVAERGRTETQENAVCVYLTDGYGAFPETAPKVPVLWAVTAGGLQDDGFPFGTVARMAGP